MASSSSSSGGFQQTGFNQSSHHIVRVTAGSRTSVLKAPAAPLTDVDRGINIISTTGCDFREIMETGGTVFTGEVTTCSQRHRVDCKRGE